MILPAPGTLYICLHRGAGVLASLIKWQTRGDYSHVSLLLPDGRQIEAWWDGVQVRDQFDAHGGDVDFFTVSATPAQVAGIVAQALSEKGCGYDFLAVGCFVTRMRPGSPSRTRWFCSELVYWLLCSGGIPLFSVPASEAWRVDPAHVAWSTVLEKYAGQTSA